MANYGLQKTANAAAGSAAQAATGFWQRAATVANNAGLMSKMTLSTIGAGFAIKRVIDKIRNDINKKRLLEDLALNNPVLKQVPKDTLVEWYASICLYAPRLCTDKHTVAEVLQNFARFGKVDINTLKMLAETDSKVTSSLKNERESVFGALKLVP